MHHSGVRGFTLLELLVTIAVAAILLGIAVPSYRSMVQQNTMASVANDLVGDLNYARSQAVTRGQPVYLCKSADQSTCTNAGDWSQGWIVYSPNPDGGAQTPDDSLIRVHAAVNGQITISGDSHTEDSVSFNANGFAMTSNGSFELKGAATSDKTDVIISTSGRIRTEDASS